MKITTLAALGGLALLGLVAPPRTRGADHQRAGARQAARLPHLRHPYRAAGFGFQADGGEWRGLDIDLCRAIAAAIFDDPTKVRFVQTTAQTRFIVVQTGDVDLLARNATYTMSRDTAWAWPGRRSTTMTARASWCARPRASPR